MRECIMNRGVHTDNGEASQQFIVVLYSDGIVDIDRSTCLYVTSISSFTW